MSNGRITTKDLWDLSKSIDKKLDTMGKRVSALEVWKANIRGQIVVVVAVVFFVVDGVKSFVIKKFK